MKFSFAV